MIAVYVNEEGNTASISEEGIIRIYQKSEEGWNSVSEATFCLGVVKGISEARRIMIEMVQKLEGCNVFVAKEVVGQLYYVLEANGFESFEAEGKPELFLEAIWEEVQSTKSENVKASETETVSYFEKTDKEGFYFLNLKKALNLDCSISSKKLLLPFLRKKDFSGLDVICDHLPRWFETELSTMGLKSEVIKLKENEYKVSIVV